jgi:hypothetical protein
MRSMMDEIFSPQKYGLRLFDNDRTLNMYERLGLPEPGTVFLEHRTVTEKFKVFYDGDVCRENLRYKRITEEDKDE